MENISPEVLYGILVMGLFIVPRILQRFRLPAAITAVALGAVAGMKFDLFHGDATVQLFSTLGIVALFLFAGLEVDFSELRKGVGVLVQHIAIQLVFIAIGTWISSAALGLAPRTAALFALALLTPSTGFILDSLPSFKLGTQGEFWVKSMAIGTELVALAILFVLVQSTSAQNLGISTLVLVAMVAVLPLLYRVFFKVIEPYAPRTEFTFLILVALVCAFITRRLGVYYLVGAFVAGLSAVRLRAELPALSSERLLAGVELFASFFIPFYFFKAGVSLEREFFTPYSVSLGLGLVAVLVPLKVFTVALHRRLALGEEWHEGRRVALSIVPTLVFTLVIGSILRDQFALSSELYGTLVVYTLVNTLIPGLILRTPPPQFEAPSLPDAPQLGPWTAEDAPGEAAAQ
ncbi:MAG TPA: cation:proton antiporter [Gemmatimonadaceae bacterium]|nr:cation:proton antiporter [Gemmatimonadaceae bacterium]